MPLAAGIMFTNCALVRSSVTTFLEHDISKQCQEATKVTEDRIEGLAEASFSTPVG